METLNSIDYAISLAINHFNCHTADAFMYFVSRIPIWFPLYAAVIVWYFLKMPWRKALIGVLTVIVAFILTDIGSNFMKENVFLRYRPCEDPALQGIIRPLQDMIDGRGSLYGFPSGHACNTMCFAIITSWLSRRRWWTIAFISWSVIISYSRIYLGKHFFGDVIGGWVYAVAIAVPAIFFLKFIFGRLDARQK